jgi:2-dehydro-3-deoxygluconokinase
MRPKRIACISDAIELKQAAGGLFSRNYSGDTLNTAVYRPGLALPQNYITALGDDPLSDDDRVGPRRASVQGW